MEVRYVSEPDTYLLPSRTERDPLNVSGARQQLLGGWLLADVDAARDGWVHVTDASGHSGFVRESRVSAEQQLKIFYIDVGQGDATLIEAEGAIVVIDGGPNQAFVRFLEARDDRRRALATQAGTPPEPLIINALVVTHFDRDHFAGLTHLLRSDRFRIERLFHNGLPRYSRADNRDLDLGTVTERDGVSHVTAELDDIGGARAMLSAGRFRTPTGRLSAFGTFLDAVVAAHDAGRLGRMDRLVRRDPTAAAPVLPGTGPALRFEILGPLSTTVSGSVRLPCFPDPHGRSGSPSESHTVNGNSIVLRLTYGSTSFLFAGDLNEPAQRYLLDRHPNPVIFRADVNKGCHHGSSDFDSAFLREIRPHATIFSSGDAGTYDHPLPDALGAAIRHSRGDFPLLFSTELARETGGRGVLLGHINVRSNGARTVAAQRKEKPSSKRTWHSYPLPYPGPFAHRDRR